MEMRTTKGFICLKDDLDFEYRIAEIEYRVWENEEFEYIFRPDYSVISLLDSSLFQGIPGIDISLEKEEYVRKNIVPTFISERSPSPNREGLWELLESHNMEYLDRLEWLIRTDTKYIGDRLYLTEYNECHYGFIESSAFKRSVDIIRKLLENICLGNEFEYDGLSINDNNRKIYYDLLYRLYSRENKYIAARRTYGIEKAKNEKRYSGRKAIVIDDTRLFEVKKKYRTGKISSSEAAELLGISKSTFLRKIKGN